jgi:hypothetical protein
LELSANRVEGAVRMFTLFLFLFIFNPIGSAQKRLDIIKHGIVRMQIYSLGEGDILYYKLRRSGSYQHAKIMAISDSILILAGDYMINYRDIRKIRIDRHRHLLGSFKTVFFGLGFGFFPLNTLNQVITGNEPIIQPLALEISAALLAGAMVLREFGFKRLRHNKRVTFKFMDLNYEHLNEKKEP